MAFQVNTNINALNAHVQNVGTQRGLKDSLEKLSSGLRINKAADDASGMIIADRDSLRSQASALGQAINNTNDAMGIIQIADKAMDEQLKILDTVKVKATQAAQDGQTSESRRAIQSDIVRLIQGLDMIGNTTHSMVKSCCLVLSLTKSFRLVHSPMNLLKLLLVLPQVIR